MSSIVQWNNSYSVQVDAMDAQHQRLFELINKLHDAMKQGKGREALPELFENIMQYTKTHFSAEEALLAKNNYPELAAHKLLHTELIAKLTKLQDQFKAGDFSVSMQTRDFLRDWLIEHIKGNDLKYGAFLKQK
jgi:hemerythrin-like metal-binding protein